MPNESDPDAESPRLRPAPVVDRENEFFWTGAAEGRLLIQACADCGVLRHPPTPLCPRCQSARAEPRQMNGHGQVAAFIIVHHPPNPWFELPIAVASVELDEGVNVTSNLCDVALESIEVGMEVDVFFAPTQGGFGVPLFRPVKR
jgi:uncharacterized OB-fold protein